MNTNSMISVNTSMKRGLHTHCEKWLRKSHSCWKRLAEARYARMKSYYTAVSTSAAVLVGMLAL